MANTVRSTDLRDAPPSPIPARTGDRQWAIRPHKSQPAANPFRRRLGRITIGFWLGGIVLGTGGCILGVCMPYSHPVAVTISVLWWGIYLGCFGASVGALLGLWAEQAPAPPFQGSDGASNPLSGADSAALAADCRDT
jgi:hypothetical protein